MKKISLSLPVCFAAVLFLLSSCSSVDKNALLIPKDAAFVLHLNTNSLSSKLSWQEIKQTSWFRDASTKHDDSLLQRILDDPENSGMNTKTGFAIFAKRIDNRRGYLGFSGSVKDAAAFEAFNKKVSGNETVLNQDNLKTIQFGNKGAVSWSNERFLYLMQAPFGNFIPPLSRADTNEVYEAPEPVNFQLLAKRIFNYKKDSLLVDDDRFASLMKEEGDAHFWFNAESTYGGGSSLGMLSLLKLDVYFKGSVSASTLSFDKGKITVHSKSYSNKEMKELFKKYSGNKLKSDLVKRIPSDNVVGVFAMNYQPEGLKEFLKLGGLDGMINSFLGDMNITLDDFIAANKGDLLLAVTDLGMKEKTVFLGDGMDSFRTRTPDMNILFVTSVGNKAAFDKLMAAGKKLSEKEGTPPGVFYNLNNEFFVAGNNQQAVDQYLKGGSKDFAFLSKINDHPIGFYIDINKIITAFNTEVKDSTARIAYDASVQMWKDLVVTGGEFKNDAVVQEMEVNLVDQNTNSLKQLNIYADKLSAMNKRGF